MGMLIFQHWNQSGAKRDEQKEDEQTHQFRVATDSAQGDGGGRLGTKHELLISGHFWTMVKDLVVNGIVGQ